MKYFLKIGISLILLAIIVDKIDLAKTWAHIRAMPVTMLLAAFACQMASTTVAAIRWTVIMHTIGIRQPFLFFLASYFKGAFFNQGLPTSIGGDAMRILDCSRFGSPADVFYGVFIDRIIGLAGLLILNLSALSLGRELLPARLHLGLTVLTLGLLVAMVLLFFLPSKGLFAQGRLLAHLGQLAHRYRQVYRGPAVILGQLALSVLTHLLTMGVFFLLGSGLNLSYGFTLYLALVPPVILLLILPISLAGWGVREGALVSIFLLMGAAKERILSLSLLYGLISLAASLPGLAVYLLPMPVNRSKKTR